MSAPDSVRYSLDIRPSDGVILSASAPLRGLLCLQVSVLEQGLSLYSLLSPEDTWRLLDVLLKAPSDSPSSESLIFRFTGQHCLRIIHWEAKGPCCRVTWDNLHQVQGSLGEPLLGFRLQLEGRGMTLRDASPNFSVLLGHPTSQVLGTTINNWIHPEDTEKVRNSISTSSTRQEIRFKNAQGSFDSYCLTEQKGSNQSNCTTRRLCFQKDSFSSSSSSSTSSSSSSSSSSLPPLFSTLQEGDGQIRMICCHRGIVPSLPNLGHRNFMELVSSSGDVQYLEGILRKGAHSGLTRLYEIRMDPMRLLSIQSDFLFLPNNDILGHHFILRDREESLKGGNSGSSSLSNNNNNNVLKRKWDPLEEDTTTQKNKLLRELLNINYTAAAGAVQEEGTSSSSSSSSSSLAPASSSSSSNSRILQLLNSKTHDLPGYRRKTSSPSVSKSFMCSQNPALADLLSKPPYHASSAVPPPVPTKWHQEPREKLPRDIMRKYLPPHPAERSSSKLSHPSDHDPMLSEILDGVIDIQEKTPSSGGEAQRKRINLSDIERFLSSTEMMQQQQQQPPQSNFYAPPPAVAVSPPTGTGRGAPLPRMNELLQVIPPNVTIPPNSSSEQPYSLRAPHNGRRPPTFVDNHPGAFTHQLPPPQPQFSGIPLQQQPYHHHHPIHHLQHQQMLPHQETQQFMKPDVQGGSNSVQPSKAGGGSLLLQLLSE